MQLEKQIKETIQKGLRSIYQVTMSLSQINLQPTRKEFEGSYTFTVFKLAAQCKEKPSETAHKLGNWMVEHTPVVANFNVVNGFLNISIASHVWIDQLDKLGKDLKLGYLPKNGQRVVVEFSSPNTNKPLHLGHLRNNFLGSALAAILEGAGYEVYKVNLVNDRGIHICKSMVAYQQFGQRETPITSGEKGDHFVGRYYVKFETVYRAQVAELTDQLGDQVRAKKEAPILQAAQQMLQKWEQGDKEVIALWQTMNGWVYEGFDATYQQLKISFDTIYYESQTYLLGKEIVDEGLAKNVFYKKENGAVGVDLTDAGLDEKIVLRPDGTAVYITQDMGTADLRYKDYQFDKLVYVVGNEQDYHFKVLFQLMERLGRNYASEMYHLSYGMVDLPTGKMKSREGNVVDADHLIARMVETVTDYTQDTKTIAILNDDEKKVLYHTLAMGALKFFLLRVAATKRLLFDPVASIDFQGDTGIFVQYTYARIASIVRKGAIQADYLQGVNLSTAYQLTPIEETIIMQLSQFSSKLVEAASQYIPATLANYVLELAKNYNKIVCTVTHSTRKRPSYTYPPYLLVYVCG